jgi:two-component system NtrC family response regulator
VKLLRFLQEQTIERVGGRQEISVDVRVIAATNANLTKALESGTFREDLYYRLAVIQIALPPLRERDSDIELLARAFLHRSAKEKRGRELAFGADALNALRQHAWPGNVRELQNRVRRAVIMSDGKRISAADLELAPGGNASPATSLKEARESTERDLLRRSLRKHAGRITSAAAELGISRPTFYELMEKLGVARTD